MMLLFSEFGGEVLQHNGHLIPVFDAHYRRIFGECRPQKLEAVRAEL
jgi:hypothetical protein